MSINAYLQEIIGKRIAHIITNEGGSPQQIFLVFDDHTSMEFYGDDLNNSKGVRKCGYEEAINSAKRCNGHIKTYSENKIL